ncbi:MAG: NAD-dependent epimerase/dehydratase family protein [Treponema sp.]|nr:NAD-dependent epimerase/dehydratase family protein [Treponema sp.]
MKIIITGKNGYISTNLSEFLNSKGFTANTISVREQNLNLDFTGTDVLVHCAGIVHKKEKDFKELYEKVNVELTIELAKKSRKQGVSHFIFFSSMSVYGSDISKISENTPLLPKTLYGKSKLQAEKELLKLADDNFLLQ